MEPFEIILSGESYTIQPLISDNFEVYRFKKLIGFLTPTADPEGTLWSSREIAQLLAGQIGGQIEARQK